MTRPPDTAAAARMVRAGVSAVARDLPADASGHIPRLTLRLKPGAGAAEVHAALRAALARHLAQKEDKA